jgi:hypothetical protein
MLLLGISQKAAKKGTKGFNTPWHLARLFAWAYLPRVVARRREMKKEYICFSPLSSLQSGNAGEIQEGTSWRLFFRHFFAARQRNGIHASAERARSAV